MADEGTIIRANDMAVLTVGRQVVFKKGDSVLGAVPYTGDKNALLNKLSELAHEHGQVARIDERVINESESTDPAGHITLVKTIERTLRLRDG